ncbi:lipid-A-disaccharide synthase N-terminal domain-containing protein [Flavobacteriaceae bacterium]|nr:lipid-A-disaccharide synthase N-terminal domain-containing protein [Flavobacteriaceae bacterium]
MSSGLIYAIGFLAQILFSGRLFIQWFLSEKQKRIVTPSLFWKLSLVASFLLFVYGYLREDFAIMLGQSLTYFIYIRNLHFQGEWQKAPKLMRYLLLAFPLLILCYGYNNGAYDLDILLSNPDIPLWLMTLGIISQLVFTLRFVYQWWYSEQKKESHLPKGFWLLSTLGALMIITYALFRVDPVLMVGHGSGLVIYLRNLFIGKNEKVAR